mgnify:CR=1 FL=1
MKIRNIDLGTHPVVLAPMEDVTDIGFRLLCRRLGASMVYSEFVAADALVRMVNKSLQKLTVCDDERPWPFKSTDVIRAQWPKPRRSWWKRRTPMYWI